jgi:DNA-binding transcriptional MerR regulator
MNDEFLTTKPSNYYQTREVAEMLGITMSKLQVLAQLIGIQKDVTHIYIYTDDDIHRIKVVLGI